MKKNILSMLIVLLSGLSAYALNTDADPIGAKVHCEGAGQTLDFQYVQGDPVQASYAYDYVGYGHCPSRLCGSPVDQESSLSTDQGGVTAQANARSTRVEVISTFSITSSLDAAKNWSVSFTDDYGSFKLIGMSLGEKSIAIDGLKCHLKQIFKN